MSSGSRDDAAGNEDVTWDGDTVGAGGSVWAVSSVVISIPSVEGSMGVLRGLGGFGVTWVSGGAAGGS